MTHTLFYQHKFQALSLRDLEDLTTRISDILRCDHFKYDEDDYFDVVLVCGLNHLELSNILWNLIYGPKMMITLKTTKYNPQTYRDDEIVLIYKHSQSIEELNHASRQIGYLNIIGAQQSRPVIAKLYMMRYQEIINQKRNV